MHFTISASAFAALLPLVSAHGYITGLTANGVTHPLQAIAWYYNPTVKDAGWRAGDLDSGFVASSSEYINSGAISCHRQNTSDDSQTTLPALPALGAPIPVAGGSTVQLTWDTWAQHPGPTLDYMAKCPGPCNQLKDATQLQFFKIRESGLKSGQTAGVAAGWESSMLPASGGVQSVNIPNLVPGEYVLRHEIIALHSASSNGGGQMYPLCFNLNVTGSGTMAPSGMTADKFYSATDPGILIDIYYPPVTSYPIPGPTLAPGIVNVP